jgi:transcriptional regulator with XRE-family HTH domain
VEHRATSRYDVREVTMDHSTTSRQLAKRIRLLRLRRGWSAQQLADKCARAGMPALTRGTIAKIESFSRQSVTADELAVLADVLHVSPTQLLAAERGDEALYGAVFDLVRQAGNPTVNELAEQLDLPRAELADLFQGRKLPDRQVFVQVVQALGGDSAGFAELWRRASESDETTRLLEAGATGTPVEEPPAQPPAVAHFFAERTDVPWTELLTGLSRPERMADPARKESVLTFLFLEVGLKMADEDLEEPSGPAFGWRHISRERVVNRALALVGERRPDAGWAAGNPGLGAFKHRWQRTSDYLQDLVTYTLYSPRWRDALDLARAELFVGLDDVATGKRRFSDLIISVAEKDMVLRLRFARYVIFQLALAMDSTYSRVVYKAHTQFHERYSQSWAEAYDEALKKLGFTLRPGVDVDLLSRLFGSLAQGLSMLAADTGDDSLTRSDNDRSLLAEGVMLMILGSVDMTDNSSVDEAVDMLIS